MVKKAKKAAKRTAVKPAKKPAAKAAAPAPRPRGTEKKAAAEAPTVSPIITELLKATKAKAQKDGESDVAFAKRLAMAVNNELDDAAFDKLSEPARDWYNKVAQAIHDKEEDDIALPGAEAEAADEGDGDGDDEGEGEGEDDDDDDDGKAAAPRTRGGKKAADDDDDDEDDPPASTKKDKKDKNDKKVADDDDDDDDAEEETASGKGLKGSKLNKAVIGVMWAKPQLTLTAMARAVKKAGYDVPERRLRSLYKQTQMHIEAAEAQGVIKWPE